MAQLLTPPGRKSRESINLQDKKHRPATKKRTRNVQFTKKSLPYAAPSYRRLLNALYRKNAGDAVAAPLQRPDSVIIARV